MDYSRKSEIFLHHFNFLMHNLGLSDNGIFFKKILSTYLVDYTTFPDTMNIFIPFKVSSEKYNLRLSPEIDSTTDYFGRDFYGNEIAEYPKGSLGYALAEKKDSSGRIWWFVLMTNNIIPIRSFYPRWEGAPIKYFSIGWMSSKYLERLD